MRRALSPAWWLPLLVLALFLAGEGASWADGHGHKKRKHRARATPDPIYTQACGQCHMAYPPCLLPEASWRQLMEGRRDHFSENLSLSQAEALHIQGYLMANAADRAGGKRSRKIMDSLGGATPLRPSQVPYLRHKHRKIGADTFARPAVGGMRNCRACHPGAEQGDFDDDRASIPR
ncbi:MAG: cytochrome C [Pseudomonadota bacterium]